MASSTWQVTSELRPVVWVVVDNALYMLGGDNARSPMSPRHAALSRAVLQLALDSIEEAPDDQQ